MPKALVLGGGGPLAVAWEAGILAGLAGPSVSWAADFTLGTSAGAIVGSQLCAGRQPAQMADAIRAEKSGMPPPGAMPRYAAEAVAKLPEIFLKSVASEAGRIEVGAYAVANETAEDEPAHVARMQRAIAVTEWPQRAFGAVAIDVGTGEAKVLDRSCGGPLAAAVAASCSLPGLSRPVGISGRRYMDGGLRSATNADLLTGFDTVVVLCFHLPGPPGERVLARTNDQADRLRAGGAKVRIVSPDAASLAAIGVRSMDVLRRPDVVNAALAQGRTAAHEPFWPE